VLSATKSRKFSFIAHSISRRLLLLKLAPTSSLLLRVTFGQCCSNSFQKALAAHSFFREGFKSSLRISTCNEKQEVLFRCTTYFRTGSLSRTTSNLWVFVALRNLSKSLLFFREGFPRFFLGKTCEVQRKRRVYFRCTSYFRGYINLETSNQPKDLDSRCK
jgi:hypothetical protein